MISEPTSHIIGGMFSIPPAIGDCHLPETPDFLQGSSLFLTNARSGIMVLLDHLNCARVWLPSYLCPTIIQAVQKTTASVMYYEIDQTLSVASLGWLEKVQKGDLILFIDYFGFFTRDDVVSEAKRKKAWILEDACQALLNRQTTKFADFILYSPRKFVGVPDGGILASRARGDLIPLPLKPPPDSWWLCNLEAAILRREYDKIGIENNWFNWYVQAKKQAPIGYYRMSELSNRLLRTSFDYDDIARKRIENFRLLLAEIPDVALFKDLPDGIVPLGFPIRVKDRDKLRKDFFNSRIYPPIHWEIEGVIPERFRSSLQLSTEILTLPCDQRYGEPEMKRMVKVIKNQRLNKLAK